jgi:hypothetical protein
MTYPNPHYDPEWQAACTYHFAEAKRLQGEIHRLAAGGSETYAAYREAEAEFQRHHQAGMATYKRQHKTVQEYAAWVFQSFSVTMGLHDVSVIVPEMDFETFRTIEEVDVAWSHHRQLAETAANDQRLSLPIGQPEGVTAFADATSQSLTRAWREFTPRDLYPDGYPGTAGVWTIMTTDEQADGWHICFTHTWGSRGISVTNAIERLASAVYREASAFAAQQPSGRVGPGLWIGRLLGRKPALLDPGRFHFYDHTPPAPGGSLREDFSQVMLRFEDGEFKNPDWRHFRVIPNAIQSARFDLAAEGGGMGSPVRPVITDERPGA